MAKTNYRLYDRQRNLYLQEFEPHLDETPTFTTERSKALVLTIKADAHRYVKKIYMRCGVNLMVQQEAVVVEKKPKRKIEIGYRVKPYNAPPPPKPTKFTKMSLTINRAINGQNATITSVITTPENIEFNQMVMRVKNHKVNGSLLNDMLDIIKHKCKRKGIELTIKGI